MSAFLTPPATPLKPPEGLVVIGVSTGGPKVLEKLLPQLPAEFPWPVVVVQHMPAQFTGPFADRLARVCPLSVVEAGHEMLICRGKIYVARGGCDAILTRRASGLWIGPAPSDPTLYWHPSVDVMMGSALEQFAPGALIGVMLTGMGYDGARAMTELHRRGGRTVAESEGSAVVWGMPGELVRREGATQVAHHGEIANILNRWLGVAAVPTRLHASTTLRGQ